MTPTIKVDVSSFKRLANMIQAASANAGPAMNRAVNRAGDMAKTAMIRTLAPQTGLRPKVIRKALRSKRASSLAGGSYVIESRGGDVRLKYFSARETRKGVSAAPWSQRQIFAGTFIKGGRFPNRVTLGMGGHVFKRTGAARKPIIAARSGVFIPEEMISGSSAAAFYATADRVLPERLAHELLRILGA